MYVLHILQKCSVKYKFVITYREPIKVKFSVYSWDSMQPCAAYVQLLKSWIPLLHGVELDAETKHF